MAPKNSKSPTSQSYRDPKAVYSWALYDWANSTYSTTVMAGFFPLFYKSYWSAGADAVTTTARLGTLTSAASLIVALLTPGLGALADQRRAKKRLLFIFMLFGAIGVFGLGLLNQGEWESASFWYALATIGFSISISCYDSLLPAVATDEESDRASSLGYGLGYLGGGVLFLINVLMYMKPEWFGLADGVAGVKASFISVAIWWFVFTLPLMKFVKEPQLAGLPRPSLLNAFISSFTAIRKTAADICRDRNVLYFLLAFWLYIDGVYTVMTMAVDFGLSLGLEAKDLIGALLLVQFIGFPAAIFTGAIGSRFNSKAPILACIVGYAAVTVLAAHMSEAWHFYVLAVFIGLVQGGVQALSRSLFARMIPQERSGEYFGFMNLIGRFAAVLGPFLVAQATLLTGDHRSALQSLLILFGLGGFLLTKVRRTLNDAP